MHFIEGPDLGQSTDEGKAVKEAEGKIPVNGWLWTLNLSSLKRVFYWSCALILIKNVSSQKVQAVPERNVLFLANLAQGLFIFKVID